MSVYSLALDKKLIQMRNRRPRIPVRVPVVFGPLVRQEDTEAAAGFAARLSAKEKACYLDGAAKEEARLPGIRSLAAVVLRCSYETRARELFDFVRRNVDYLLDPDAEEYSDAITTLIAGQDDCDGSAKALVALCIAAGLEACLRAIMSPDERLVDHFQAMIRWPGSTSHPAALAGGWIIADTTLEGVALGQGAEAAPTQADGEVINLREVRPGKYGPVLQELRRS